VRGGIGCLRQAARKPDESVNAADCGTILSHTTRSVLRDPTCSYVEDVLREALREAGKEGAE
jgi:hypothetical protein